MRESLLYERLPNGRVVCHVCQWRCKIAEGHYGVCKARLNQDGKLYALNYAEISSIAVDPVEKKPLFHFHPGSQVLSLGSWGCNFRCQHCQNWHISYAEHGPLSAASRSSNAGPSDILVQDKKGWRVEGREVESRLLTPAEAIRLTESYRCSGLAWTYNEPSIWLEYTLEGAQLAHEKGLYTAYVTNGFMTVEALDTIGPLLDAYRVDVKGFGDRAYTGLTNIPKGRWLGILEVAQRAQERWGMHVEVVTNIVPGYNDDDDQIKGIARWIVDHLGPKTPWHITRFFPHARLRRMGPTPIATLQRARLIGRQMGLSFVYLGNVVGADGDNTYCPDCSKLAIQRMGYKISIQSIGPGGCCGNCGADLNIRMG